MYQFSHDPPTFWKARKNIQSWESFVSSHSMYRAAMGLFCFYLFLVSVCVRILTPPQFLQPLSAVIIFPSFGWGLMTHLPNMRSTTVFTVIFILPIHQHFFCSGGRFYLALWYWPNMLTPKVFYSVFGKYGVSSTDTLLPVPSIYLWMHSMEGILYRLATLTFLGTYSLSPPSVNDRCSIW